MITFQGQIDHGNFSNYDKRFGNIIFWYDPTLAAGRSESDN